MDNHAALARASLRYTAPFACFIALMMAERELGLPTVWMYPLRVLAVTAVLLALSRPVVSLRLSAPLGSILLGVAVFAIWIGPDAFFGAAYRHHWIFENGVTGHAASSAPQALKSSPLFIAFRAFGCVAVVPVVEELFWRSWLMRWLANHEFWKLPLGAYAAAPFWVVALLFASEHGPYWEVGLAAGILYNWWMIRTKSLGDCILAHAVTNALLSAYVLAAGKWEYWL